MAKTKISELDAAAANNTDINSVDVSEGCAPSGINNAIREMGAMLKRMDNGTDHLTNPNITGDLDVDNININGNTISSTDTNGNINITPNGTGAVAFTTNATFGDNDKAVFGAGSDLQIYTDGTSNDYIDSTTSHVLQIRGSDVRLGKYTGETFVRGAADGAVTLYYDNAIKLATTSSGIDVTGTVTADGLTVDGGANALTRTSSGAEVDVIELRNNATATNTATTLKFANSTAAGSNSGSTELVAIRTGTNTGDFVVRVADSSPTMQERLRITSGGNVGIGTASPAQTLHLKSADPVIRLEDSSPDGVYAQIDGAGGALILSADGGAGSASSFIGFRVDGTALGNEAMRIDSSGNVGIGTSSPQSDLSVKVSASRQLDVIKDSGDDHLVLKSSAPDASYNLRSIELAGERVAFSTGASSGTSYTERMRIDSSGNLLVGKTAANSTVQGVELSPNGYGIFTPSGNHALLLNRLSSDGAIATFRKDGTTVGSIGVDGNRLYINGDNGSSGGGLKFTATDARPVDRLGSDWDDAFDLGDSSARFKDLYLSNSVNITTATNGTSLLDLGDTADSNIGRIAYDNSVDAMYFKTNNSERLRITSGGNVLFGCASFPSASVAGFAISGTSSGNASSSGASTAAYNHLLFYNGNGIVGYISTSGSSTTYSTSSDYRLKENVADMTGAIDRVKALAPKRFNFIADADTTVDGFLAHEAQTVVPEAVTGTHNEVDDDGNAVMQGIDQSKLVPLLTAALKESIAKIETLEARVAALEAN